VHLHGVARPERGQVRAQEGLVDEIEVVNNGGTPEAGRDPASDAPEADASVEPELVVADEGPSERA
jgi:hypothetical protein